MIEGHGDDLYRYGERVKHNFSSNIFAGFDHSRLVDHLSQCGWCVGSYPEPEPYTLESMLAEAEGVGKENVIVTNGATESIYLLAQMHRGGQSAIVIPTFREYQDACRIHGHKIAWASSPEDIGGENDMVWICNPNNPTGQVFPKDAVAEAARKGRRSLFVIDRAYDLYCTEKLTTAREAVESGNIVLLSSLTKQFAIPGLRIGYAIGPAEVISGLRALRMPWSVNAPAIEAAIYLLRNKNAYKVDAAFLASEARRIREELKSYGIECSDSDCNFFLAKLPKGTSAELKDYLIERHGILIRDASNFEGLGPRHFRVAAQTPEENDLLLDCIGKWMKL